MDKFKRLQEISSVGLQTFKAKLMPVLVYYYNVVAIV